MDFSKLNGSNNDKENVLENFCLAGKAKTKEKLSSQPIPSTL